MTTKRVTDLVNPALQATRDQPEKLVNYIALVLDGSGSMSPLIPDVIREANAELDLIKEQAYKTKQDTYVSVYGFSDGTRVIRDKVYSQAITPLLKQDFYVGNMTALLDAVRGVASELGVRGSSTKEDQSFLVITLTDGQENHSTYSAEARDLVYRLQRLPNWSFAFLVPPGGTEQLLKHLDVPRGNIREWETTREGLRESMADTRLSTGAYFEGRSMGQTQTRSFYTDLSSIAPSTVKRLPDVTQDFKRFRVTQEEEIAPFVLGQGYQYSLGRGYYELTKPETIQSHKDIVIQDRTTGLLHGGPDAKALIGIVSGPGVNVRVTPGNHHNYRIFVQSTSMNRKLVRGTYLLYRIH